MHIHRKEEDRGAHRNVSQKATEIESAHRDESGGNREVHDHPHRPTGKSDAALRTLPAAMSKCARRAKAAGVEGSFHAESAVETALPPTSSRMPQVRSAGGGLSLGGAVGASDHGAVECGSDTGSGVELAGNGPD